MAELVIMTGEHAGKRFAIEADEVSVGRASDNFIAIVDPAVSSHHFLVRRDGRVFTLKDNDSTNGTRLNGEPVKESRLNPNDVIQIGAVEISIQGDDIEAVKRAAPAAPAAQTPPTVVTTASRYTQGDISPAFTRKKDNRGAWLGMVIAAVTVAVIALVFFVLKLARA